MKIKRIAAILVMTALSLMLFASCASEDVQEKGFENPTLEIALENGKAVVRGSFDNCGQKTGEYSLNYEIVKNGDESKAIIKSKTFPLTGGINNFEFEIGLFSVEQTVRADVSFGDETVCEKVERTIKSLRLLSIGNSFSVDAQQHLYGIAKDMGYDNIVLGNLYIGGCSLNGHCYTHESNKAGYIYYKNTTGTWEETPDVTMLHGLTDERWDYITLQQSSGASGDSSTYTPYLRTLIKYVNENKLNPTAEILWHMTWAYSSDSTHVDFPKYDNDQMKMYESIVNAVNENVVDNHNISYVIPVGTAIQNARATELGDTLCRDGFHLELGYGRYLAGLTWIHKISGESVDDVSYIPDNMFDENTLEILKVCAKNAVETPFEVTK